MQLYCDQHHDFWWEHLYNTYYENSPHNSKHLFDVYSLTHIFWCLLIVYFLKLILPIKVAIISVFLITTLFEVHENTYDQIIKYQRIEINSNGQTSYRGDTLLNVLGDIISNVFGIYLGATLYWYYAVVYLFCIFAVIKNVVGIIYFIDFFKFLII